jgi:hypothetical protein
MSAILLGTKTAELKAQKKAEKLVALMAASWVEKLVSQ